MNTQNLLMTVQHCEATCENMITMMVCRPDVQCRRMQIQLLRDCADICTLMAKYLARNSIFSKCLAALCALVCETCGRECARFPDPESQHCAQVCLNCAQQCRAFSMMP